jgi:hypothetical protein
MSPLGAIEGSVSAARAREASFIVFSGKRKVNDGGE